VQHKTWPQTAVVTPTTKFSDFQLKIEVTKYKYAIRLLIKTSLVKNLGNVTSCKSISCYDNFISPSHSSIVKLAQHTVKTFATSKPHQCDFPPELYCGKI